jgi:hypothetical protein
MATIKIDPFSAIRKNAHIWRGERALIWYQERLDGSFTILTLYDFGDTKRRLFLEIDDKNKKVEFKNDELSAQVYQELKAEIETIENMMDGSN